MRKANRIVWIALASAGIAVAQDTDLRSGRLPLRTALVSEEVARQKLETFGFSDVRTLRLEGRRWHASVNLGGRAVEVELDAVTGTLHERGHTETLLPDRPAVPMIRDHAIKVERAKIVEVPVPVEHFAPARPSVIRPIGDRPIRERPPVQPSEPSKSPADRPHK